MSIGSIGTIGSEIGSQLVFIDYLILGLVLVGLIYGACVGFLREFVNLVIWGVSFTCAVYLFRPVSVLLTPYIPHLTTCLTVSFLVVFYAFFLLGVLIRFFLFRSDKGESPSALGRLLGAMIGALKASIWLGMLVWLLSLTSFPETDYWKNSYLLGKIQIVSHELWRMTQSESSSSNSSKEGQVDQGEFSGQFS